MSCLDWERSDQRSDHQLSRLGALRFSRMAQTMSFLGWDRSDHNWEDFECTHCVVRRTCWATGVWSLPLLCDLKACLAFSMFFFNVFHAFSMLFNAFRMHALRR